MSALRKMKRGQAKIKAEKGQNIFAASVKKADKVARETVAKLQAINDRAETYFTACSNIITVYVLRKTFRLSAEKTIEFIKHYCNKSECIIDKLTTYEDMVTYEIKHIDKEFNPLKWTDYQYPFHQLPRLLQSMPGNTDKAIADNCMRAGMIHQAESVFAAHEILVLSALHDHCGFGLIRCKRLIKEIRKLEYSTPNEIIAMMNWLVKSGIGYSVKDVEKIKGAVDIWKLGLKDKSVDSIVPHPDAISIEDAKKLASYCLSQKRAFERGI